MVTASAVTAETVAGLPLHVDRIGEGAIRVWIGDHISSTTTFAFATEKGLVIIDTTGNPEVDRQLREAIARELGRDDFVMLINTHEHRDHTGGNAVYADCTIVGHELVEDGMSLDPDHRQEVIDWYTTRIPEQEAELEELAPDSPEAARLREDLILNRMEFEALKDGVELVPPTLTFSDRMVLDMGDTTFELYYIGGMHTASDAAILVPEHNLLLTGDTMSDVWLTDTPGCLAAFMARSGVRHDFPLMLENYNRLLARRDTIRKLMPSHWNGELSFSGFEARVKYVETIWNGIGDAVTAGGTLDDMMTRYRLDTAFPHLAESPGFNARNNYGTIMEIWSVRSGQQSAATVVYDLIDQGADEAEVRQVVAQRDAGSSDYYFMEAQFNAQGYRFLQHEKVAEATAMFRINVDLYPESWNVYDSLGEALLAAGDQEEAIAMYEKSLQINPENENGKQMLERIRSEASVN
jgi:glyoxylase-like metal-dependent hydrolase (beta-lactamase superfamily II)